MIWTDAALFAVAFTASAALPGPDTMLVFSRALAGGAAASVPVGVGLTVGKLVLLTAAIAGVAAAALAFGPAFLVLKVAGALYLLWLAIRLWRRQPQPSQPAVPAPTSRLALVPGSWRGAGLGAVLTMTNPQALLFYLTVLPGVLEPGQININKFLILCLALCLIMAAIVATYTAAALRTRSAIPSTRPRTPQRVAAVVLAATAIAVAAR